ncbi:MAG: hypothetical protein GF405_07120 [Candidatus Eisenbacteria bacterium]|nr:hypothetical protein [Candidatus Eisenbacteria bacterium]
MRRATLILTFAMVAVLAAGPAFAMKDVADYTTVVERPNTRSPIILFFDDVESGVNGWTSVDNTASASPKFHLDSYYAYQGSYSWWCGELNAAFAGGDGYANGWDQRLVIPSTDVSGAYYPILTYAFRHDSEPGFDFTYVQAESSGVYVDMNRGYDGSSGGWQDIGAYGFVLAPYDNPVQARFRFVSDGAWSDSDGLYDSDGGAFMVDNIKIFDFYGGYTYFYDDGETGGLCTPSIPASAGDYWHIVSRACPAYSDPHCWWCGDDADTTLIPPNLDNSLISPAVNIAGSSVCTLRFLLHAEVPTVDNDYWTEEVTVDGGSTWVMTGAWWGDFGQCDGWGTSGISGTDLSPLLPGTTFQFRLSFYTTDNGCGPGAAGGAGIMLDDTWLEDWTGSPVEETTWGAVKSMFR